MNYAARDIEINENFRTAYGIKTLVSNRGRGMAQTERGSR